MNRFERAVGPSAAEGLSGLGIGTVQVNVGLRCNQCCAHCHVGASPQRKEVMTWATMEAVLKVVRAARPRLVDITGGAPEMNPNLRRFITALGPEVPAVRMRTNFTALLEPGNEKLPEFLRERRVELVGSMPCYLEENVAAQRGAGVYEKSVAAIRHLNSLGYGRDPELLLDLVYNPGGPFLPPAQEELEADYRRELGERFGIVFTRLLTIANMPIGRFLAKLRGENGEAGYRRLLEGAFNPQTVAGLMCRHQISVGWEGTLYDCDFNLALGLPVDHGAPSRLKEFDAEALSRRRIVTGEHCFGCTAGQGSSCGGALAEQAGGAGQR